MSTFARPVAAGLIGAAGTIALITVVSRVVGFGRWVAQASAIGPTPLGDAYNAANTLPNVLFEVAAGGALAGAVVPLIATALTRGRTADVDRIASALLGWTLVVLVPIAGLVALLARPLVSFALTSPSADEVSVAAGFLTVFAVQIPLYGLGVVLSGVLQAHHRFLGPALAPLLSSVVVVTVYLTFGELTSSGDPADVPAAALAVLGWGTTAGVAAMSLPLLWPVHRLGVRLRPVLSFPDGVAARARPLALAGIGALLAQQASVVVILRLANAYGTDGTFPVFLYSQAVYLLPYAVLAVPLATATFPRLAERAAHGDHDGFARLAAGTTRALLVVSGAGAAALIAAAPAVERVFLGLRPGDDFSGMAVTVTAMAPGLLGFALVFHLSRALYSLDRGRAAVVATVAGWLVLIAVALVAVPLLSSGGPERSSTLLALGAASSIGMTVAGAALVLAVVRAAGRRSATGVPRTLLVLVVTAFAGASAGRWVVEAMLPDGRSGLGAALLVGALGGLVAASLVAAGAALADRGALGAMLASRRRGAAQGSGSPGPTEQVGPSDVGREAERG